LKELSINITIAGRSYPISVPKEQEAEIRNAGKLIQDKLQALADEFAVRDKQDALAMFALELASENQRLRDLMSKKQLEIESKLQDIIEVLPSITI
jgi:cell division protein ZapA